MFSRNYFSLPSLFTLSSPKRSFSSFTEAQSDAISDTLNSLSPPQCAALNRSDTAGQWTEDPRSSLLRSSVQGWKIGSTRTWGMGTCRHQKNFHMSLGQGPPCSTVSPVRSLARTHCPGQHHCHFSVGTWRRCTLCRRHKPCRVRAGRMSVHQEGQAPGS